ncbi:kinesin-like protein KIF20A isoform X2 [Coccinella septempunctata]|uniref:kinesin-like protein KIF20A isoform X2 n=1 Tax=Coccinella septempunctata TaxID=41139 RepID=UPI001D05C68F|nr:kinesin-like protein KIF20A isoform X2 [Coccinella septempunctata]
MNYFFNNGIFGDIFDFIVEEDHLHVYLRIKDGIDNYEDLYEVLDSQTVASKVSEGFNIIRNSKDDVMMKKYNFSKIFGPKTTQLEIFNELVKTKLLKFINGHNSSLLTYGVSSSGKTYTIVGTAAEPGVVPRSLEYLFRTLPVLSKVPTVKPMPYGKIVKLTDEQIQREIDLKEELLNFNWPNSARSEHINTYCKMQSRLSEDPVAELEDYSHLDVSVWVSFTEIYNEHIYDLLQSRSSKKEKLKLGCANGETYVKNLKLVHVTSGLEAYQILQYGLHHLNYAKTNINDHSSRSHSIFTIWLTQTGRNVTEECHISHFNFCDLAGAERSKKTLNVGERLKESNNINTSLLVLGRCIAAVRKAQQSSDHHIVPFRESKLTQLFQKALSGLEDICMIVNINPCRELFDETQHVLNFSAIAKDIVVVERPVVPPKRDERISQLLSRTVEPSNSVIGLEKEKTIQELKNELAETVCKLELEELDQTREIEMMRNRIMAEYTKQYEEHNEQMEYELLALKKRLREQNKKRLQVAKLELMQELGVNVSDIQDDDSDASNCSSREAIYVSSSDDESIESDTIETITIVSSDEEEEESEVDKWRRKVEAQETLIAEHHKTISRLTEQIEEIKLRYGADMEQLLIEKDLKIQELMERVQEIGEESPLIL